MSITLGDTLLNYKKNENKYIITYIEEYNTLLDNVINDIFVSIFPHYGKNLWYSNVCGANAEFICKKLKLNLNELKLGKIIINDWVTKNDKLLETIESVYGNIGVTIGASYHALAYLTVLIEGTKYYVAIETTSCVPYKLQFYVGSNENEFNQIIKTRYQCNDFKISFDCDKSWTDIIYSGGKKRKTKKRKNKKTEKTKKPKKQKNRKTKKRKWAF